MNKLAWCGVIALATLGYFVVSFEAPVCDRPGTYTLTQDDETITLCHNGKPQIWQKAITVKIGSGGGHGGGKGHGDGGHGGGGKGHGDGGHGGVK